MVKVTVASVMNGGHTGDHTGGRKSVKNVFAFYTVTLMIVGIGLEVIDAIATMNLLNDAKTTTK